MSKAFDDDGISEQLDMYDTRQNNLSANSLTLAELITDLQLHSLSFNNHTDLSKCMCINKSFHLLITNAQKLWRDILCKQLWKNKTYIPKRYRNWINSDAKETKSSDQDVIKECSALKSYRCSFLDQTRTVITIDELCSIKWYFRFKEAAGVDWLENDPFWQSDSNDSEDEKDDKPHISTKFNPENCIRIQFQPDGSSIRTGQFKNVRHANMTFTWKFTGSHNDDMEYGNAIQVNNFPQYHISRHPNHWGWIMQSCWVMYASFPFPRPGSEEDKIINNDLTSMQYSEMMSFNIFGSATRINSNHANIYKVENPFSESGYIEDMDVNNDYEMNDMRSVHKQHGNRLLNVLSMLGSLQDNGVINVDNVLHLLNIFEHQNGDEGDNSEEQNGNISDDDERKQALFVEDSDEVTGDNEDSEMSDVD